MKIGRMGQVAAGALAAAVLAASAAAPAYAWDRATGYQECNANRLVAVSSTTTISQFFNVSHVVGDRGKQWLEPGYHTWVSPFAGGDWEIYTTGTITSGGAGCA